jgi:hypothetical protein
LKKLKPGVDEAGGTERENAYDNQEPSCVRRSDHQLLKFGEDDQLPLRALFEYLNSGRGITHIE